MSPPHAQSPKTIVVAGASGFVGRALPAVFKDDYRLIGLTRQTPQIEPGAEPPQSGGYMWRHCDLFSRKQSADALEGADLAVYLVHPMRPTAALTQGDARDMDLLCADNFARAARRHNVAQIVYLSGHISESEASGEHPLNPELAACPEIEQTLAAYGATVSMLRLEIVLNETTRQALAKRPRSAALSLPKGATREVRSVQRLPLPAGRNAHWVATTYAKWLPRFMRPFIKVRWRDERWLDFLVRPLPWPILAMELDTDVSKPERELYWIVGGLLSGNQSGKRRDGRLEFREVLDGKWALAAIHDFHPRLPWPIYVLTQAKIHLFVMHAFARYLGRLSSSPRQLSEDQKQLDQAQHPKNQNEGI